MKPEVASGKVKPNEVPAWLAARGDGGQTTQCVPEEHGTGRARERCWSRRHRGGWGERVGSLSEGKGRRCVPAIFSSGGAKFGI